MHRCHGAWQSEGVSVVLRDCFGLNEWMHLENREASIALPHGSFITKNPLSTQWVKRGLPKSHNKSLSVSCFQVWLIGASLLRWAYSISMVQGYLKSSP